MMLILIRKSKRTVTNNQGKYLFEFDTTIYYAKFELDNPSDWRKQMSM